MLRWIRATVVASSLLVCAVVPAQTPTATTLAISATGGPATTIPAGTVITLTAAVTSGTPATFGQVGFCDADAKFCTDIHLLATSQLTAAGAATYKFTAVRL